MIESIFDPDSVKVFQENKRRREGKHPGIVCTPIKDTIVLPINAGIKKEVETSVLSAVGSLTPAVRKEAKWRINFNADHQTWNDTVKVAKTLVQEAEAKHAIQAQQDSIKSAVKQRDAAFKLQEELKVEIKGLGPRLERAREGLKELEETYFKSGHYVPPYIYRAQRDLKRTILAIVSCLASAQDRLLKVKDNIRDLDQILFSAGAATCSLCGHHLQDNAAETHEAFINDTFFQEVDKKGEGSIVTCNATSSDGSSIGSTGGSSADDDVGSSSGSSTIFV